jgi:AcrR family transcriptional regulator
VARSLAAASRKASRRAELVDAALAVFSEKGVSEASVDDIVRAAGVAKGTFYLYFRSKEDVVTAVAARMVGAVAERAERMATATDRSPVGRLLGLAESMDEVGRTAVERELIVALHRPENRAIHDRMSDEILVRLEPTLTAIISDGVADGSFQVQDPRHAAWFVLSTFGSLHHLVADPSEVAAATAELDAFILRGLGHAAVTGA